LDHDYIDFLNNLNWQDPKPGKITYNQWNDAFKLIPQSIRDSFFYLEGTKHATSYLNDPRCFAEMGGDSRLHSIEYDNSLASIRLWSFLLSEETRLFRAKDAGKKIIGTLKDLGTVPVLAYSSPDVVAFYPDGAWWIPCIMEMNEGLLKIADQVGFGEEVCPARAALAAFIKNAHFPRPDLLTGAVGSCCDDFSAIMQRIADTGIKMAWWELPYRRDFDLGEPFELLPSGRPVQKRFVDFVEGEMTTLKNAIEEVIGYKLTDDMITNGIIKANRSRELLSKIRDLVYGSVPSPFPALETQICEMLIIHFCSDQLETEKVLTHVLKTVEERVKNCEGVLPKESCRVVWVNPVADLRAMNVFERLGGAIAGSEYLFRHALLPIRTDISPLRALALQALSDPMIGPSTYRADIVCDDAVKYKAEGVVISNIPGASHCATEGSVIREMVTKKLGLPVLEITVSPLTDSGLGQLSTRFEAFFELIRKKRRETKYVHSWN